MSPPRLSVVRKPEDDARLLDAFRASPIAQKAMAQQEATEIEHRAALVAEIEKLDKAAALQLPLLRAQIDAAFAELDAAEKLMRRNFHSFSKRAEAYSAGILAQGKIGAAQHKSIGASFQYSAQRDRLERELRETASPAIKLFKSEMLRVFEAARATQPTTRSNLVKNLITGRTSETRASNAPSIRARTQAARRAMDEAGSIALEPDQRDVEMRLEKLRQSLPAIGAAEFAE